MAKKSESDVRDGLDRAAARFEQHKKISNKEAREYARDLYVKQERKNEERRN